MEIELQNRLTFSQAKKYGESNYRYLWDKKNKYVRNGCPVMHVI